MFFLRNEMGNQALRGIWGGRLDSTNHRKTNDTIGIQDFMARWFLLNSGYVRLKHPQQHVDYRRGSWILWPKHPCYAAAKTVAVSFGDRNKYNDFFGEKE